LKARTLFEFLIQSNSFSLQLYKFRFDFTGGFRTPVLEKYPAGNGIELQCGLFGKKVR
jgi:hypothetical protein